MRRKIAYYAFNKKEITILRTVASGSHFLSAIRNSTKVKPSLLSHYLKTLQEKGFLEVCKPDRFHKFEKGKQAKTVYFKNLKHAAILKDLLIKNQHMKWENILSGTSIDILFQILSKSKTPFENVSLTTSWRYLGVLKATGLIEIQENNFRFNDRFKELVSFLEEYQQYIVRQTVRSISEEALILWQKNFEVLIQVPKAVIVSKTGFMKTATSCFANYGLQITSNFDNYFYSTQKNVLRIEDIILHILLLEKNSVRNTTYCLLLLQKNQDIINQKYFTSEAAHLGLTKEANTLEQFLKTKGDKTDRFLPSWSEFIDKMDDYGVDDSWSVVPAETM